MGDDVHENIQTFYHRFSTQCSNAVPSTNSRRIPIDPANTRPHALSHTPRSILSKLRVLNLLCVFQVDTVRHSPKSCAYKHNHFIIPDTSIDTSLVSITVTARTIVRVPNLTRFAWCVCVCGMVTKSFSHTSTTVPSCVSCLLTYKSNVPELKQYITESNVQASLPIGENGGERERGRKSDGQRSVIKCY